MFVVVCESESSRVLTVCTMVCTIRASPVLRTVRPQTANRGPTVHDVRMHMERRPRVSCDRGQSEPLQYLGSLAVNSLHPCTSLVLLGLVTSCHVVSYSGTRRPDPQPDGGPHTQP
jgi:hypothetical protein